MMLVILKLHPAQKKGWTYENVDIMKKILYSKQNLGEHTATSYRKDGSPSTDHRDIIHRGSLAINLDTFKVKPDLAAQSPVKWLKFTQCVASHCQSRSAVWAFVLPLHFLYQRSR